MFDGGDGGVSGLFDIVGFVFLNQGSLECSIVNLKFGGVDGDSVGGRGEDGGSFGEDVMEVVCYLGSVRGIIIYDNFINVQNIKFGFFDNIFNKMVEVFKYFVINYFVVYFVDGSREVKIFGKRFDIELSVGVQIEGFFGVFGFGVEFSEVFGVGVRVDVVVFFYEFFGEVVYEDVVEMNVSEFVVVCSSENSVYVVF